MMRHFTIGVAGHVDHGKTSLVRRLTGIDTDFKPEEKQRGMSIEAGVAPLCLPSGRQVGVVDVPGHTDFLKNTVRGLSGIDAVVLTIAADDGVMPQTREHLEVLRFFRIAAGCTVLSKTDLVDEETVDLAEMEAEELVRGTFLEDGPFFRFSATRPKDIRPILAGIDAVIDTLPAESSDRPFRLWIDQVKSIPGYGTVVSGTVASGLVRCGDTLTLMPSGTKTRARSLESHGRPIATGAAGQRIGVNLHGIGLDQIRRGMSLAAPGAVPVSYLLNAEIQIPEPIHMGIRNRQRVKIYLGTSITVAAVVLMEKDRLEPGETGLAQLRLMKPAGALPGDSFVMSFLNLNTVIGGGRVLEVPFVKYRPAKSEIIIPPLQALRNNDVRAYTETVFAQNRSRLITAGDLAEKTGLPEQRFEREIRAKIQNGKWMCFEGRGAITQTGMAQIENAVRKTVSAAFQKDPLKKSAALSEIARGMPFRVQEDLLALAADSLCLEGRLVRFEGGFRPPAVETSMDARQESIMHHLLEYARTSGVKPFNAHGVWQEVPDPCTKTEIIQMLNFLSTHKRLVRLPDQRFVSLDGISEIKALVARTVSEKGFVTVRDSRELFGFGRMIGSHLLDYLDRIGFTERKDDRHYLKRDGRAEP